MVLNVSMSGTSSIDPKHCRYFSVSFAVIIEVRMADDTVVKAEKEVVPKNALYAIDGR